jgi:hypothetical protein
VLKGLGLVLSVNNVLRKWTALVAVYLSKLQFRPPLVKEEVDELRKLVDEMYGDENPRDLQLEIWSAWSQQAFLRNGFRCFLLMIRVTFFCGKMV